MDQVVITADGTKSFADFQPIANLKHDKRLEMYFETTAMHDATMSLLRFHCPSKNCSQLFSGGWTELKAHVKTVHKLAMCELCTRFKKVFTHEHTLFTADALKRHMRQGDPDDPSFKGHPECTFCLTRFYDHDQLYAHCREMHEQCFLCMRQGIRNQYYVNYLSLEEHFGRDHFMCTQPKCLETKFVVFESLIDLKGHEMEAHADARMKARGAPISINFTYSCSNSRLASSSTSNAKVASSQPNTTSTTNSSKKKHVSGRESPLRSRVVVAPEGFGTHLSAEPIPADEVEPEPSDEEAITLEPTPAEAAAILARQERAAAQQQPMRVFSDNPELTQALERLFDTATSSLNEFKQLAHDFKAGLTSAFTYLEGFMALALRNRSSQAIEAVQRDAASVWLLLADSQPDEANAGTSSASTLDDNEWGISKKSKRKAKKGVPLAEFEAQRKAMPKKQAMLKAWTEYYALKDRSEPVVASSLADASPQPNVTKAKVIAIRQNSTTRPKSKVVPVLISETSQQLSQVSLTPPANSSVDLNEFPSLPQTASRQNPRRQQSEQRGAVRTNSWLSNEEVGNTNAGDQNRGKKNKKGKNVLVHFG